MVGRDSNWALEEPGEDPTGKRALEYHAAGEKFVAALKKDEERQKSAVAVTARPRLERIPSCLLGCKLDHQVRCCTLNGLALFKPRQHDADVPFFRRPHATLQWDTHSPNVCVTSFLLGYHQLRVTPLWGPLHRIWRCIWNGTKLASMMSTVLLTNILVNLERGPWRGEANYQQEKDAVREMSILDLPDFPIFRAKKAEICRHLGVTFLTEEILSEIIQSLWDLEWMDRKPGQVAMTRWSSWHDAVKKLLACLPQKALVLIIWGSNSGLAESE